MRWIALVAVFWLSIEVAHADWFEATTPRVRVLAKGNEERARSVAERLERFDAALRLLRGLDAVDHGPAARLTVYVVDSPAQVGRLAGASGIAGFYSPRAGGSVAFVPRRGTEGGALALNAEAVLLHEYAHHFMFRNYPGGYPAWLSEGFAEFHATAKFDREGGITIGQAPMYRAHGLLSGHQLPIERLLEPGSGRMNGGEFDNLYGRGWLLMHLLTFSDARQGQLSQYLKALRAGMGSVDAGKQAFGDLRVLNRELERYMRQSRMSAWRLPPEKLSMAPIELRALSQAESALMDVHIESTSGVTPQEAARLLPRVQRAAAPYPNDAFAQGVLAEAEYDAGNYAAARDAALRSIAADPNSRQGLIYHGMALAALAREAKDGSRETYRAIIAPWIRANRRDPDDARPMMLIYHAAREFGHLNDSIVNGLKYAQRIAPEDRGLRMSAIHEYLDEGELDTARVLAASLAYDRHAANREQMAALLALIDEGDREGAIAALSSIGRSPEDTDGEPASPEDQPPSDSRISNVLLRSVP